MSLYNLLFGSNPQTDFLLATIGLKQVDVERLRNVFAGDGGETIEVYTRTGGGNRDDYPQEVMRALPGWQSSEDDDFDGTYCTDTIAVPEEWRQDVANLSDIMANGLRPEFVQHIAKTLSREPTEADTANAAYEAERVALSRTEHFMANGHTFVPKSDRAMEEALKLAEANGGKLRSCWGILPINLTVQRDFVKWPNARDEAERKCRVRVEVGYDHKWSIDHDYWAHCQERFSAAYPLTMANIAEQVSLYVKREAAA